VETEGGVEVEAKGRGIIVEGAPILHGDGDVDWYQQGHISRVANFQK
jgi:hypothetical protein